VRRELVVGPSGHMSMDVLEQWTVDTRNSRAVRVVGWPAACVASLDQLLPGYLLLCCM
jgi:hypothetical protein